MACIIDIGLIENQQPTFQDFKTFNKSGPDIENQLAAVEEYQEAVTKSPRSPLVTIFSRVNVFSFLPIFGAM
jgi:hypothetical protein